MKIIFIFLGSFLLLSCQTIRFSNSSRDLASHEDLYKVNKIHHIGILGLVEYSDPVMPKRICSNKKIISVQTEVDLKIWAIGVVGYILSGGLASLVYTPMAVSVYCGKNKRVREIASIRSSIEEDLSFKVLKITYNKAIIYFKEEMPRGKSFKVVGFEKKIHFIKKGQRKALVRINDLDLKIGRTYKVY